MAAVDKKLDQEGMMSRIREGITLIDFNAPWCAPCREQHPVIEKLIQRFRGQAHIIELNVDKHPGPAMSLGITSIPTLIVFKKGKEFQRFIGKQSEETLSRALEEALNE